MVSTFLRIRDVPPALRRRVHIYFDALWDKKRGMDENAVIKLLPSFLRHDLIWSINRHFLEKVPMFIGADANCLMIMNKFLVHEVITRGEFLVRTGDWESSLFFVTSGSLVVWGEGGEVEAELYEGSVVGEVGIILQIPAVADMQARTTCDLLCLSRDDYARLVEVFPAFEDKLIKRAERLYGKEWERWKEEAALRWAEGAPMAQEDGENFATPREQTCNATLQRQHTFKAVDGGLSPFTMGDVANTRVRRQSDASPGRSFDSLGMHRDSRGRRNSGRSSPIVDTETKQQVSALSKGQADLKARMVVMESKMDLILAALLRDATPQGQSSTECRPGSCSSERRELPVSLPVKSPRRPSMPSMLDLARNEDAQSLPGLCPGHNDDDSWRRSSSGSSDDSLVGDGGDNSVQGRGPEARQRRRSAPVAFVPPTVPQERRQSVPAMSGSEGSRPGRRVKMPPALHLEAPEPIVAEESGPGAGGSQQKREAGACAADTDSPASPDVWSRVPTTDTHVATAFATLGADIESTKGWFNFDAKPAPVRERR